MPKHIFSLATGSFKSEPSSFKEVVSDPKSKAAMTDEFDALICKETWELVPLTNAQNIGFLG